MMKMHMLLNFEIRGKSRWSDSTVNGALKYIDKFIYKSDYNQGGWSEGS